MSKLSAYGITKKQVQAAYLAYCAREPESESHLLDIVTKFVKYRVINCTYNLGEVTDTADDHSQDICLYVWGRLPGLAMTAPEFYSWLNRIAYVKGTSAFTAGFKEISSKVPLVVPCEDDDGMMDDNPLIHRQEQRTYIRPIPEYLTKVEQLVCKYIREGLTYKQIAYTLGSTEPAIKMKVNRIKKKVETHNA